MPVIAESPPIIFGGTPTPTRTPTPTTTPPPGVSSFVARHEQYISRVDSLNACFKRQEISDFTDQEFLDHSAVAMIDRYITQEKDIYCSMKGIQILTKALKRLGEE